VVDAPDRPRHVVGPPLGPHVSQHVLGAEVLHALAAVSVPRIHARTHARTHMSPRQHAPPRRGGVHSRTVGWEPSGARARRGAARRAYPLPLDSPTGYWIAVGAEP
jgi:hypothetical protein